MTEKHLTLGDRKSLICAFLLNKMKFDSPHVKADSLYLLKSLKY